MVEAVPPMSWPRSAWHRAYEDMRAERDRLLTLVERLADQRYRLDRREAGLTEREPEQIAARIVLTPEMRVAAAKWGSSASMMLREAERSLRAGVSPLQVLANLEAGGDVDG